MDTLPSIPSRSSSFCSPSLTRSSTRLLAGTLALDDTSLLAYELPGGAATAPSRSSFLRRASSFDELTRDLTGVVLQAREGSSTGVMCTTGGGHPVTISSEISVRRGQESIVVRLPPRRSRYRQPPKKTILTSSKLKADSIRRTTTLPRPKTTFSPNYMVQRWILSLLNAARLARSATRTRMSPGMVSSCMVGKLD